MQEKYEPTVTEGYYPEDAGWTTNGRNNVLLVSIPIFSTEIHKSVTTFDYAWVFNVELDAYILCIRVNRIQEFAVIFQKEHAGQLLKGSEITQPFSFVITTKSFEELEEDDSYYEFPSIEFTKYNKAPW